MGEEIGGGGEAGLEVGRCGEKHVPDTGRDVLETDMPDKELIKGFLVE